MGGYGSTRWMWVQTRHYTGECLDLDMRRIKPYLAVAPISFGWHWLSNRGKKSNISIEIPSRDMMVLNYTVTRDGGQPMVMRITVPITWTACNYGGERPWFCCPACERRVLMIYLPPGSATFRCRHCHDLAYTSQQSSEHDRLLDRIRAIQRRLGGDPNHLSPWHAPPKPTGMRWQTYWRLVDEMDECERRRDVLLTISINRLLKRSDWALETS